MRPATISRTATAAVAATRTTPKTTSRCLSTFTLSRPTHQLQRQQQHQHRQLSPRPHISTPTSPTPTLRTYHSYDHPPPPGPFNPTEEAILSAAYKHVPEHGFSAESLALGAREAGYLDISTNILPEGAFSLIRYHLVKQREALAGRKDALFGSSEQDTTVAAKVEALTWERLLANGQVITRWQEALAIMAQPSYIPSSLSELAKLSDEIYFLAGDVSVDPSWYTKRASLSATYAAAELFMTDDHSADFRDTREFLRRRLGEASEVGNAMRSVREWVGFAANAGVNVLRSKGVRI